MLVADKRALPDISGGQLDVYAVGLEDHVGAADHEFAHPAGAEAAANGDALWSRAKPLA
jgi:hypothetical protein